MEELSEATAGSFPALNREEDVFEAVAAIGYASLDSDLSAIATEDGGELTIVSHLASDDDFRPATLSRLSIPGLCQNRRESSIIDDRADVRSQAANAHAKESAMSDFRSLLVTPLGESELIILGAKDAEAFTEEDLRLVESIGSFATAYLEDLRSDGDTNGGEWAEQIAAVLSHDLDNILTTISGNVELAKEEGDTDELERVERNVDRLKQVIDDAVTALRSGGTQLDLETVDLSSLGWQAWDVVGNEGVQLIVGDLGYARADRSKLQQVFENLLSNAIEHGDSNGLIWIGRFEDGIYIEDDGPGIPSPERERVFESGYSSTTENTGFGLNIVEWIVEAHGWEISVEQSEYGGARFEISGMSFDGGQ